MIREDQEKPASMLGNVDFNSATDIEKGRVVELFSCVWEVLLQKRALQPLTKSYNPRPVNHMKFENATAVKNWVVATQIFFIFTRIPWKIPILTSIFFRWVGSTTNQKICIDPEKYVLNPKLAFSE